MNNGKYVAETGQEPCNLTNKRQPPSWLCHLDDSTPTVIEFLSCTEKYNDYRANGHQGCLVARVPVPPNEAVDLQPHWVEPGSS